MLSLGNSVSTQVHAASSSLPANARTRLVPSTLAGVLEKYVPRSGGTDSREEILKRLPGALFPCLRGSR
jgi:hypothetical protein